VPRRELSWRDLSGGSSLGGNFLGQNFILHEFYCVVVMSILCIDMIAAGHCTFTLLL